MTSAVTDYSEVPWFRKSSTNSAFVLLGLLLPPLLWFAVLNLLTGDVYFNDKDKEGRLKTWGIGNKVVAILFVVAQAWYLFNRFAGPQAG